MRAVLTALVISKFYARPAAPFSWKPEEVCKP